MKSVWATKLICMLPSEAALKDPNLFSWVERINYAFEFHLFEKKEDAFKTMITILKNYIKIGPVDLQELEPYLSLEKLEEGLELFRTNLFKRILKRWQIEMKIEVFERPVHEHDLANPEKVVYSYPDSPGNMPWDDGETEDGLKDN